MHRLIKCLTQQGFLAEDEGMTGPDESEGIDPSLTLLQLVYSTCGLS